MKYTYTYIIFLVISVGDNLNRKKLHQYVDRMFDYYHYFALFHYLKFQNFSQVFPEKKTFD